jgi:hypothetical protein
VNACKTEIVPFDIWVVNKKARERLLAPAAPDRTRLPPQHQGRPVCSAAGIKLKEGGDKGAFFCIVIFA